MLSCVRVNGTKTETFPISIGVRQGDTLSPTLFALYVNDLCEDIKQLQNGIDVAGRQVSILMYADDIVLFSETEEGLQVMLDCLYNWIRKWRMSINADKTKVVHFRRKNDPQSQFQFHVGNGITHYVDSYRYLGLCLNYHLDYSHCVVICYPAQLVEH